MTSMDASHFARSIAVHDLSVRDISRRVKQLTAASPDLGKRYEIVRGIIRAFRKPSFYEISQKCNLWCEGCYYFTDAAREAVSSEMPEPGWEAFFAAEHDRGVSMAYLVGAEPSLYANRLRAASRHIRYGKIGTNGTIAIPDDIACRIGVSVWGNETDDTLLRGGAVLRKAMTNYAGDPRAIMLFTLSPWNLDSVDDVVRAARDHGIKVTFSMYSPTTTYMAKMNTGVPADSRFFRLGPSLSRAHFSQDDLKMARDRMRGALENYPDSVVFCDEYCELITAPGPIYDMDPETGVAINCGSRIREPLRYFDAAGAQKTLKCCTPDVDCRTCRLYSGSWSMLFKPTAQHLADRGSFEGWLTMVETLGEIFLYPSPFGAAP